MELSFFYFGHLIIQLTKESSRLEQRGAGTDDDAPRFYRERRKGDSGSYPRFKEQKGTRKGSQRP